jgi:molybdopterin synthase sulfur carrier subunit
MSITMTITIQVPSVLRSCCEGASEFTLSAGNVRSALEQIVRSHPSLYNSVCDETGSVRPHVNLFVNSSLVRRDREGLDTSLASGDVLSIFQAVSGG